MRCHICNSPLSSIQFDHRDGIILPCGTCEEIIHDTFMKMDKKVLQTELDDDNETGYTLYEGDVE